MCQSSPPRRDTVRRGHDVPLLPPPPQISPREPPLDSARLLHRRQHLATTCRSKTETASRRRQARCFRALIAVRLLCRPEAPWRQRRRRLTATAPAASGCPLQGSSTTRLLRAVLCATRLQRQQQEVSPRRSGPPPPSAQSVASRWQALQSRRRRQTFRAVRAPQFSNRRSIISPMSTALEGSRCHGGRAAATAVGTPPLLSADLQRPCFSKT